MQFSKAKQTLVDMLPKRERGRSRTGVEILINKPGNFGNFRQLALGLPPPLDKPQNQRAKGSWNFSCCHKKLHMHGTHPPCAPSLNPLSTKSKAGQVRQTFALEKAQKRSQRRRKGTKKKKKRKGYRKSTPRIFLFRCWLLGQSFPPNFSTAPCVSLYQHWGKFNFTCPYAGDGSAPGGVALIIFAQTFGIAKFNTLAGGVY